MRAIFRHDFDPSVLREYDIRGIVGQTLGEDDAYALGVVFASVLRERGLSDVLTGHDGRLTSPALEASLVAGLVRGGLSVGRLPCCPTPALYHAAHRLGASGAIMVTGSHNPLDFNGFKLVLENRPFFGASLRDLGQRASHGVDCPHRSGPAPQSVSDAIEAYVDAVRAGWSGEGRPLRVVWDNVNSSAGPVLAALTAKLPGEHLVLNSAVDGRFPAHHPDPTLPENMHQLKQAVLENGADLGVGFDGDADRLGVLDDRGVLVPADKLTLLLAQPVMQESPGAVILGDVKMSSLLFDGIAAMGGKARMCPSGHSEVKAALSETGGLFAGEMSGHFLFADCWPGFDDGIYAATRLIDLLSRRNEPLSSLCDALPSPVVTPEIRFPCPDDVKFGIIDRLIARSAERGDDMTLIDGLRVTTPEGWWLLRASNTQPALVARVEGRTMRDCRTMLEALGAMIEAEGVAFPQVDDQFDE
ncbi:phosphomannomutase/phosphoglucomutase [Asaia lannensis]|uniref:Phosphomannomutase/phosphoglucomutase n=1 Tax=Asaia lannensis NBRC 102526 TaxID=1307926 RepID=A0ABT1CFA2_9PROT|nr:phosphomannomutase/phosphoglucomutase [Asaia lannensis]MCO6159544.1 phosphomannomutase/phosphoglucomutase [Asaia lannensis NBRC 102526]GBQ98624.1 phosphomannomutase [Asaia lannensis NBRC 102526]